jgi:hypothetical protein
MMKPQHLVNVPIRDVQPDDIAEHVGGQLDPRRVTRTDGEAVYLSILGAEAGPFPLANYTYQRWVD